MAGSETILLSDRRNAKWELNGMQLGLVNVPHCIYIYKRNFIITETLRISPPGFLIYKVCGENTELVDYDGRTVEIEKGTVLQIPMYSIHNDHVYFPNPSEFNPDRFDPVHGRDPKALRDLGLFAPFGMGPRICIGKIFAESKASRTNQFQVFRFSHCRYAIFHVADQGGHRGDCEEFRNFIKSKNTGSVGGDPGKLSVFAGTQYFLRL